MSTPDIALFVSLAPAISGLVGVLVGAVLTMLKESWVSHRNDVRDARYLAVQVVGLLDRYIFACSEVVTDNGLFQGQRDANGNCVAQVKFPDFSPETLIVEWRSIPGDLMYEIFDLPYKAGVATHIIEGASENAYPPEYDDYFEERKLQYANLGLQAAVIADRLRNYANLPERSIAHWDPITWMSESKLKIETIRTGRAKEWEQRLPRSSQSLAPSASR